MPNPTAKIILLPGLRAAVRRRLGLALCVLGFLGPLRAAGPTEAGGWQLLSGYLFRDAYDTFSLVPGDGRTRALGLAASRLNHPPVTESKVAEVEEQLQALVAADGTDDTAMYARLLLARVLHLHRPAARAETEAAYREVIKTNPAHPVAQIAAGKLALLLLYERPDLTVPQRLSAAAEFEAVAGADNLPEAACAYYRALAGGALYYEFCDERVLGWLQRAAALGPEDPLVVSNLRIQLAEVARALGRREEAIAYYRNFLATILPTDNRYLTARERMAELEKAAR